MPDSPTCPLCRSEDLAVYATAAAVEFWACACCGLIHRDADTWPDLQQERSQYLTHENDPEDARYQAFLTRLAKPVLRAFAETGGKPATTALDYGCGPTKGMATVFRSQGVVMQSYDPIFHPRQEVLQQKYDCITACEVLEHMQSPGQELQKLFGLLTPGGCLGVMTQTPPSADAFSDWYYHRDPTHICFFPVKAMDWIGREFAAEVRVLDSGVTLFLH